jgi:hypothetical protein
MPNPGLPGAMVASLALVKTLSARIAGILAK